MIDKLAWVVVQNRRFLATRSYGKSQFYLPGGKRESGETDQQALIREIQEELSVSLNPESLIPAKVFRAQADGKPLGVEVQLTCYWGETTGTALASAEIEELAWLNSQDKSRCSVAALKVLDWLVQRGLID
ncbi:NUDIX hydrolase [Celerinatantimonas yamalensis]|uniref:8-oxo-dGTP diphosphatase n=1 Tax=Celerinatantimonas yamalensis TaxID=559956 RepID=A0ABW9G3M3_9GAMM